MRFLEKAAQNPAHLAHIPARPTPICGRSSTGGPTFPKRCEPTCWRWSGLRPNRRKRRISTASSTIQSSPRLNTVHQLSPWQSVSNSVACCELTALTLTQPHQTPVALGFRQRHMCATSAMDEQCDHRSRNLCRCNGTRPDRPASERRAEEVPMVSSTQRVCSPKGGTPWTHRAKKNPWQTAGLLRVPAAHKTPRTTAPAALYQSG